MSVLQDVYFEKNFNYIFDSSNLHDVSNTALINMLNDIVQVLSCESDCEWVSNSQHHCVFRSIVSEIEKRISM